MIAPEGEEIPLAGQVPSGVLLGILTKLALFAANAAVDSGGAIRLSQEIAIIEASVAFFTPAKLDEIIRNCVILGNPFCNRYYN